MNFGRKCLVAFGVAAASVLAGCGQGEPRVDAGQPAVRRLTEAQYRNVIADLFGPNIVVSGRFDPLPRTSGLATTAAWTARVTPAGLEQFDRLGRSIADQVVSSANRGILVPCQPVDEARADAACSERFFAKVGRMLMRHPMPAEQLKATVDLAGEAAGTFQSFYQGLGVGLASLLVSPSFLYIIDTVEPARGEPSLLRLNAYAKASRLSFLLWNSTPDDALLVAAENGELETKTGVRRQVGRMIASPRLESGVRAFFGDMLAIDEFEAVEKDSIIYPSFSMAVAKDAKEQALRTITDLLVTQRGDYRDLFTNRKTYISGPLGRIYQLPVPRPDGGWARYEFPEGDPRSSIISQIAFAAQHSHPGRSSPTLRGRAIRESILCQKVPDPPGNVDFSQFAELDAKSTTRERLNAHATQAACAGCHKITDPIGLALEKIDGVGQLRETENDKPIDTSGELDGIAYDDAIGLGRALHDNPAVPACVVTRLYAYATGRGTNTAGDKDLVSYLQKKFAADGYRIVDLLRTIAESDAFLSVSRAPVPAGQKSASTDGPTSRESES